MLSSWQQLTSQISWLQISILNNPVSQYLLALLIFFGVWIIFLLVGQAVIAYLQNLSKKTSTTLDDTFINIIKDIKHATYFAFGAFLASKTLTTHPIIDTLLLTILIIFIILELSRVTKILSTKIANRRYPDPEDASAKAAVDLVTRLIQITLWIIGILFLLSNQGINISSLIAGLGIGGVAVALAAQNLLGDLFSSFAIFFDKPFVVGDFIAIGDHIGEVEHIGVKTTRIRSISGEQLVVPNTELTSSKISNYGRMERRRISFQIGVTYDTPEDKLKSIPDTISDIITAIDTTELDRVHFKEFGDSALIFEIVYFVTTDDYNTYMDTQQQINLDILHHFEQNQIDMAFPTRTVILEQEA